MYILDSNTDLSSKQQILFHIHLVNIALIIKKKKFIETANEKVATTYIEDCIIIFFFKKMASERQTECLPNICVYISK